MYSSESLYKAYDYIQGLRAKGKTYGGYPVYNITKSDLDSLMSLSIKYGIPFEYLFNLINFETGRTFNPAITNSIGATGLIQFLPSTAKSLGTTTDSLRRMSFKEQLKYVDKYLYSILKNKLKADGKVPDSFTQGDLFMTIFYPLAVGKPDFVFPDSVKRANAGISKPMDYVEKALNVAIFPLKNFPYKLSDFKKDVKVAVKYTEKNIKPITLTLGAIGVVGLFIWMYKNNKFESIGKLF